MQVSIRKFRKEDVIEFHSAVRESIEHVSKWFPWCTAEYSIEEAESWVLSAESSWLNGSEYRFLVVNKDTDEILGSVGINQVVKQHRIGNLGYWIKKSALNNGVAKKASRLAVEYAFDHLGFNRIEVHVLTDNLPSISVAEGLGGICEGIFRNKLYFSGVARDAKCYSIIPEDYK